MGACICPTPSLVKVFLVDTIIELLLKRSGDIIKFVAGPLPDVYLKALLFFRGFLTMITQKHGRKLASQLGEVLFVCQFYGLQIETKVSLSLRNFVVALSVCVCPSSPQRHYTSPFCSVRFPLRTSAGTGTRSRGTGTHKTQTTSPSLTESWCRVIWERTG